MIDLREPTLDVQPRVLEISGESAFAYLALARRLSREGRKIISFGIGQPDYPTPSHIREEAKRALDEGFTGYTETAGIVELREAIAFYLNSRYKADVDPEEIIVTTGAKTAIFVAIATYVRPGDEVIITDPAYNAYAQATKLFGGRPVLVPLDFEPGVGFRLDVERVRRSISERTRMIVINSPHNPTGTIIPREQVDEIYEIAKKHNLILLSDEIYDNFLYEPQKFKSVLEFPDWRSNVVYVNGFSKTFSMTGWRLGYLVARREVIPKMIDIAVTVYSNATSFAQKGAVAAIRGSWEPVYEMIEEFKRRADVLYKVLSDSEYIEAYRPEGAFYMFPRVSKFLEKSKMSAEQLVKYLLYEHGVLVLPGSAFSERDWQHIRFSFATKVKDIIEGGKIVVEALRNYRTIS
ncbi:MAG: pyridoxal phosphate-dependent aminotransferase [Acidilobaceae archaeon]|nr:pyridoxal phosphate-dependent aminotransferase [Acidilobaceae archaeon]MCX8166003.1 pyridoxal phosphate-dependent aminotransferase [Acidilobaceae archaeon]MDW7974644.1 pyridoxal phosphate-dependent aminotransferase [Sulfolobales archaeon]